MWAVILQRTWKLIWLRMRALIGLRIWALIWLQMWKIVWIPMSQLHDYECSSYMTTNGRRIRDMSGRSFRMSCFSLTGWRFGVPVYLWISHMSNFVENMIFWSPRNPQKLSNVHFFPNNMKIRISVYMQISQTSHVFKCHIFPEFLGTPSWSNVLFFRITSKYTILWKKLSKWLEIHI